MSKKIITSAIIVIVLAGLLGSWWWARSMTSPEIIPTQEERVLALVSEIEIVDDQTYVTYDPVDWLQGDEAIQAAAAATDCPAETITECAPSLNNNFYIRNETEEKNTFVVAPAAKVTLQENATTTPATIVDAQFKLAILSAPLPFQLTLRDHIVIRLEEVYLP